MISAPGTHTESSPTPQEVQGSPISQLENMVLNADLTKEQLLEYQRLIEQIRSEDPSDPDELMDSVDSAIEDMDQRIEDMAARRTKESISSNLDKKAATIHTLLASKVLQQVRNGEPLSQEDFTVLVDNLLESEQDSILTKMSLSKSGFANVQSMLAQTGVKSAQYENVAVVREEGENNNRVFAAIDKLPDFWRRQAYSAMTSGVISVAVASVLAFAFGLTLPLVAGAAAAYAGSTVARGIADKAYRDRLLYKPKEGENASLGEKIVQERIAVIVKLKQLGETYKATDDPLARQQAVIEMMDTIQSNPSENLQEFKKIKRKARWIEAGASVLGGVLAGIGTHAALVAAEAKKQMAQWGKDGVWVHNGQLAPEGYISPDHAEVAHQVKQAVDSTWHTVIRQEDAFKAMQDLGTNWQNSFHAAGVNGPFVSNVGTQVPLDVPAGQLLHIANYSDSIIRELAVEHLMGIGAIESAAIAGASALGGAIDTETIANVKLKSSEREKPLNYQPVIDRMAASAHGSVPSGPRPLSGGGAGGGGDTGGRGGSGGDTSTSPLAAELGEPTGTRIYNADGDTTVVTSGTTTVRPGTARARVLPSLTRVEPSTSVATGDAAIADTTKPVAEAKKPSALTAEERLEAEAEGSKKLLAKEISRGDEGLKFECEDDLRKGDTVIITVKRTDQLDNTGEASAWHYNKMPRIIINGEEMHMALDDDDEEKDYNTKMSQKVEQAFAQSPDVNEVPIGLKVVPKKVGDEKVWSYDLLPLSEAEKLQHKLTEPSDDATKTLPELAIIRTPAKESKDESIAGLHEYEIEADPQPGRNMTLILDRNDFKGIFADPSNRAIAINGRRYDLQLSRDDLQQGAQQRDLIAQYYKRSAETGTVSVGIKLLTIADENTKRGRFVLLPQVEKTVHRTPSEPTTAETEIVESPQVDYYDLKPSPTAVKLINFEKIGTSTVQPPGYDMRRPVGRTQQFEERASVARSANSYAERRAERVRGQRKVGRLVSANNSDDKFIDTETERLASLDRTEMAEREDDWKNTLENKVPLVPADEIETSPSSIPDFYETLAGIEALPAAKRLREFEKFLHLQLIQPAEGLIEQYHIVINSHESNGEPRQQLVFGIAVYQLKNILPNVAESKIIEAATNATTSHQNNWPALAADALNKDNSVAVRLENFNRLSDAITRDVRERSTALIKESMEARQLS